MFFFPLKDLKRAEYNPRVMPEKEMAALMLSIETHGFVEPLVVNTNKERYGVIVGGHQRLTAIEKILGKEIPIKGIDMLDGFWVVPVFTVDLNLDAEKQLNIGLNKIHGKFEEDKLYSLISEMQHSPTLLSTGFDALEIANILGIAGGGEGAAEGEGHGSGCSRCDELKKSVEGHTRRTKHTITFL